MTTQPPTSQPPTLEPRKRPIRRPSLRTVAAGSAATFLTALALLGFQMNSGHDPMLGTGTQVALVRGQGNHTVTTRTSGGAAVTTATTSSGAHKSAPAPVRTATSGGTGRKHDD